MATASGKAVIFPPILEKSNLDQGPTNKTK